MKSSAWVRIEAWGRSLPLWDLSLFLQLQKGGGSGASEDLGIMCRHSHHCATYIREL